MSFADWCAGENERRVLVDIYPQDDGDPVHVRLSDETFVDDIPRIYEGRLTSDTVIERSIGGVLGLSSSASGGALHIADPEGTLDHWLDYAWAGHPVSVRLGSPEWSTNVIAHPLAPASWSDSGATVTDLATSVMDYALASFASAGQTWHRRLLHSASALAGDVWRVTVYYRRGTSGRLRLTLRNATIPAESNITGEIGYSSYSLAEDAEAIVTDIRDEALGWARKLTATVTWTSDGSCNVGLGPDTVNTGETIIALGATVEVGAQRFELLWRGLVDRISANDLEKVISLRDRSGDLDNPIQNVIEVRGTRIGELSPICYGWPKNITPVCYDPDTNPEYRVNEAGTVEDSATTRYINNAPSTSPSITKRNSNPDFEFSSRPGGPVTCDTKGAKPDSVWLQTVGESLYHALTRVHDSYRRLAKGGTTTTVVLPDDASDVDDAYNTLTIRKTIFSETGKNDREDRTISDYDGATRTATVSVAFTDAPVMGDGIVIPTVDTRYGPLTSYDVDKTAFDALDTALPYLIGLYVDDGRSANQVLTDVLGPVAWYGWTLDGRLTAGVMPDPTSESADHSLGESDIVGDIEIEQDQAPIYRIRYGYDKNHTVQKGGATDTIIPAREAFIRREYQFTIREDMSILADYPEARDLEVGSVYVDQSDSDNNRDHLWNLHSVPRQWLRCSAIAKPWAWDLGDVVTITDPRHGLSSGKKHVLVRMSIYPMSDRTDLEFWG